MKAFRKKNLKSFFKSLVEPSNLLTTKDPFGKILSAFLLAGAVWLIIRFVTGPTIFMMVIIALYFLFLAVSDVLLAKILEPQAFYHAF